MRKCAGCEAELTDTNTYRSIAKWCRGCWTAKVRERRRTNPDVQQYDRQRAKTPARKQKSRALAKRWREDHPAAYKAQSAVGNALRDGKITKHPCIFCGTADNLHAHHRDYSRPLDVDWVCAKCHHRLHALVGHSHGSPA